MAWPTPQDYNEAVQNPRACFSDADLRRGSPTLTPLGLPKACSGTFASVYRLNWRDRSWAVRCFLRGYADLHQRYLAIGRHLEAAGLPCMVGFEFQESGILIGGRWYPILKMEWIEGESIADYIARHRDNPAELDDLSRKWIELVWWLRKAEVAHGDLQHGNILLRAGELKLIDYDAMFVPALAGLESHEIGHRNYQHPRRSSRDFGPDLDHFASWVIYASISATAVDAELWRRLNAGDECLLFRREDFVDPKRSKALGELELAGHPRLGQIAGRLRNLFCLPLSQIPALEESALEAGPEGLASPGSGKGLDRDRLPAWLVDHLENGWHSARSGTVPTPNRNLGPEGRMLLGGSVLGPSSRIGERKSDELIVEANQGVWGYGIVFDPSDVRRFFDRQWHTIQIKIDGKFHPFLIFPGFWAGRPEIGGEALESWMNNRNLIPWNQLRPPQFRLAMLGGNQFRLED